MLARQQSSPLAIPVMKRWPERLIPGRFHSGAEGSRTLNLPGANRTLSQIELQPLAALVLFKSLTEGYDSTHNMNYRLGGVGESRTHSDRWADSFTDCCSSQGTSTPNLFLLYLISI